jgi:hypothetical protein
MKKSPETIKKMIIANRLSGLKRRGIMPKNLASLQGKNHWNWKGGINTPEHKSIVKNKRNFLLKAVDGSHTDEEWYNLKKKYNFKCVCCKIKKILTKDHIFPIGHKKCTNDIQNIQPLCLSCNVKKGSKIINYLITK